MDPRALHILQMLEGHTQPGFPHFPNLNPASFQQQLKNLGLKRQRDRRGPSTLSLNHELGTLTNVGGIKMPTLPIANMPHTITKALDLLDIDKWPPLDHSSLSSQRLSLLPEKMTSTLSQKSTSISQLLLALKKLQASHRNMYITESDFCNFFSQAPLPEGLCKIFGIYNRDEHYNHSSHAYYAKAGEQAPQSLKPSVGGASNAPHRSATFTPRAPHRSAGP